MQAGQVSQEGFQDIREISRLHMCVCVSLVLMPKISTSVYTARQLVPDTETSRTSGTHRGLDIIIQCPEKKAIT